LEDGRKILESLAKVLHFVDRVGVHDSSRKKGPPARERPLRDGAPAGWLAVPGPYGKHTPGSPVVQRFARDRVTRRGGG
jgi:hypothetical protein